MACHLSALAGYVIPFDSLPGSLMVWLIKKDEMPFVNIQDKEALNFQITMVIAAIISLVRLFVIIGFILIWIVGVVDLIFIILATVQVSQGIDYRYPLALRLIN